MHASESCVRALSNACRFILQFAILRHEMAKHFHTTENTRSETAFLKMYFLLRFKHFSGSGKLFKNFRQRGAFIDASRASCELIFDALKSWHRWLSNAYRFIPQFAILFRKMGKRIGNYFGGAILDPLLYQYCKPVSGKLISLQK